MKIKRKSDATSKKHRMRIKHISDTHSNFPILNGKFDVVLHSGDFFPTSPAYYAGYATKSQEAINQLQWLEDNVNFMKKWLQGHPFLFIPGNHDFLHPAFFEQKLNEYGIKAIDLTGKIVNYQDVTFYGFPYIPFIGDFWVYEKEIPEMQIEVDKMVDQLNQHYVDVLVCHAPLYQSLDLTNNNDIVGSTVIADALTYKISKDMLPSMMCHGHIHEACGVTVKNGMLISNAATTQHILELV